MIEIESKLFRSGNSIAVRLPRELGFAEGEAVIIRKVGGVVEITPKRKSAKSMKELVERLREIGPPPGPKYVHRKSLPPIRKGK